MPFAPTSSSWPVTASGPAPSTSKPPASPAASPSAVTSRPGPSGRHRRPTAQPAEATRQPSGGDALADHVGRAAGLHGHAVEAVGGLHRALLVAHDDQLGL